MRLMMGCCLDFDHHRESESELFASPPLLGTSEEKTLMPRAGQRIEVSPGKGRDFPGGGSHIELGERAAVGAAPRGVRLQEIAELRSEDEDKEHEGAKSREGDEDSTGSRASRFCVQLMRARSSDRWGVAVEHVPGSPVLLIVGLVGRDGVVQQYNKTVPPWKQLHKYDCIVSANGSTESEGMFNALRCEDTISVVVSRPREITQTVPTVGSPLGLELNRASGGYAIHIADVKDDHAYKSYESSLSKGDIIVGVNGKHVDAEKLASEIQKRASLQLHILRLDG